MREKQRTAEERKLQRSAEGGQPSQPQRAKGNKTAFINQDKLQLTSKYIVEEMLTILNYFCAKAIFLLRLEICRYDIL